MANIAQRLSDEVMVGFAGGPKFATDIVVYGGGNEQRLERWANSLKVWNETQIPKNRASTDLLIDFFEVVGGRANTFLVRDPLDYSTTQTTGIMGAGVGSGVPTYQFYKKRTLGTYSRTRKLTRPVSGTLSPQRNGSGITFGAGAGNVAMDYTTGIFTFVADASQVPTSITVGASTVLRVSGTDNLNLAIGKLIYVSGVTGTAAAVLNGHAWAITNKTGTGPWDYTINANTAGLAVTAVGTIYKYPQASDTLTCAGEFDTPARFDTDEMHIEIVGHEIFQWGSIPIVEVRE